MQRKRDLFSECWEEVYLPFYLPNYIPKFHIFTPVTFNDPEYPRQLVCSCPACKVGVEQIAFLSTTFSFNKKTYLVLHLHWLWLRLQIEKVEPPLNHITLKLKCPKHPWLYSKSKATGKEASHWEKVLHVPERS